ncbi:hypothetical protein GCM10010919_07390 [Alishewanella longhuensis]|uniref:Endonuclease/exonuclease/phosphatase domain-containing protein n=1 Tax=Alishewanella longhuensis TaxID=1091037 RepID=A0ABQ3KX40_9ALTE|nr:ExeM/NucH family extracellular endonuclease [Alishewanella longhuensis]GHG62237.1 hypothetical protein GCM10010919_07390 [Alishewanella longhuensis]
MRILALLFTLVLATGCQQAPTGCEQSSHTIAQIQGHGEVSSLLSQQVTIQGVVLGQVYNDGPMPGLMLQSLKPDNDPATAEGIFVVVADPAPYLAGQILVVSGTVAEVDQLTSLIDAEVLSECGTKAIKPLLVQLPLDANLSWEAYEGMWLRFEQPLVVADTYQLGRYGEILVADTRLMVPTQIVAPGEEAQRLTVQQDRQAILLDDGLWQQNPDPLPYPSTGLTAQSSLRVGDQVLNVEGIVHQDERGYRLLPTQQPNFVNANPRPDKPQATGENELRIASYNVLNFFTGHGQEKPFPTRRGARTPEELARQQAKLVQALVALDADVIGLLELENNGYNTGSAIATLLAAVNQQSSEPYQMVITAETPGSDAIKVGIFYRGSRVSALGEAATQTAAPFTRLHRPPVAQSFRHLASDTEFTFAVNHFKSKGSCPRSGAADYTQQKDQGDGQACWNAARVEAAAALQQWLQTQPTGISTTYSVIVGDFNAYRMEDPIRYFEQQGWQYLSDGKQQSYSFVFRGRSGSLDHMLASPSLAAKLTDFQHWPINADEPVLLDYSLRFKPASQLPLLYEANPYRSSDHDPILATFAF